MATSEWGRREGRRKCHAATAGMDCDSEAWQPYNMLILSCGTHVCCATQCSFILNTRLRILLPGLTTCSRFFSSASPPRSLHHPSLNLLSLPPPSPLHSPHLLRSRVSASDVVYGVTAILESTPSPVPQSTSSSTSSSSQPFNHAHSSDAFWTALSALDP